MKLKRIFIVFLALLMLITIPSMSIVQANSENDIMLCGSTYWIDDVFSGNQYGACFSETFDNLNQTQIFMQLWIYMPYTARVDIYNLSTGAKIYTGVAQGNQVCNTIIVNADSSNQLATAGRIKVNITLLTTSVVETRMSGTITY